ncbi:hypothetical protein G9A89_022501 [Geosiphon pyriformis]|nr:hypothetical protein G9A89_022501 [Geosiphon pyriformis]
MSQVSLLPPSPNWNASKACSIIEEAKLFVYATNESLILLNFDTFQYVGCLTGHRDRVNAVEACDSLCVSGSNDKSVRCWDLLAQKEIGLLEGHKNEVLSLAWSSGKDLIISGDKSGEIIVWNRKANQKSKFSLLKSPIYCIQGSPNHENTFAFGFQNGSILIVNITSDLKHKVLYNLQGHDQEIHSLSWQKLSEITLDQKWGLLVSGSRDKTIKVWNVSEEVAIKSITLPQPSQKLTEQQKSRLWLALSWLPGSNKIVSSSFMGNLILWDLDSGKPQYRWFGKGHNRSVFSIIISSDGSLAFTISMDRQIIQWNIDDLRPRLVLPCLCLGVHSLDISSADPSKLALGLGDNTIRIWNYANRENPFDSILLWKGLKSQITCVKWNPNQEGLLAFGTSIGAIGLMDVYTERYKNFHSHHTGKVYALDWCFKNWINKSEANEKDENGLFIFSCGADGIIYFSDTHRMTKASVNVNELIQNENPEWVQSIKGDLSSLPHRTEIAIHPKGKYIAIGNKNGSIEVFELPSFKVVYHFIGHHDCINRLQWNYADDSDSLLASGSNDCKIMIHDFSDMTKLSAIVSIPTSSCKKILDKHHNGVSDLSWSSVDHNKLVSASFDRTAIVWNVLDGSPIALFRGHQGRILSTKWSIMEADLVFTGGDDQMCFAWRPSQHPFLENLENTKRISKKLNRPQERSISSNSSTQDLTSFTESNTVMDDVKLREHNRKHSNRTGRKQKTKNLLPLSTLPASRHSLQDETLEYIKRSKNVELEKAMEFWNRSQPKNKKPSEDKDQGDIEPSLFSKLLFGDRKEVLKIVQREATNHNTMETTATIAGLEDINLGVPLDFWSNNFSSFFERTESSPGFTPQDWLILALSPSAGRDVWESNVYKMAQKLLMKNEHHMAVMYFLACGSVYEAVDTYRKANMFREAITLAKLRLPQNDSLLFDLYSEWALQLESQKRYEEAAMCHLASEKPASVQNALNNFARQGDPSSLRISASLALLLKDQSAEERVSRYQEDLENRLGNLSIPNTDLNEQAVTSEKSAESIEIDLKLTTIEDTNLVEFFEGDKELERKGKSKEILVAKMEGELSNFQNDNHESLTICSNLMEDQHTPGVGTELGEMRE